MSGPVTGLLAFDLDGTLVASAADLAAAANALTESLGGRSLGRDEVVALVGEGAALRSGMPEGTSRLDIYPTIPRS